VSLAIERHPGLTRTRVLLIRSQNISCFSSFPFFTAFRYIFSSFDATLFLVGQAVAVRDLFGEINVSS